MQILKGNYCKDQNEYNSKEVKGQEKNKIVIPSQRRKKKKLMTK